MLFRSSVIALALAACLANGTYINTGPSNVPSNTNPGYSKPKTSYGNTNISDYASRKSQAVTQFSSVISRISRFGPIFENSFQQHKVGVVIDGLVDIHAAIVSLEAQVHVGVGIWVGADLNVFAGLCVDLLVKIQVALEVIKAHGQIDACHSSIVALNAPLQILLSSFANAGVSVGAMLSAHIDLNLFASLGLTLGISAGASVNAGFGFGLGGGAKFGAGIGAGNAGFGFGAGGGANVGAGVGVGAGAGVNAQVGVSVNAPQVISLFGTVQQTILQCGPKFEDACKGNNPKALISGLVDIRASILSLSAQVNAGVSIWVGADLNNFAQLSVELLAQLQVALGIIQTYGQIGSCQSSIVALRAPLQALLSVCVNAGINLSGLIGAQVNLRLYASLGIGLDISAHAGVSAGAAFPGFGI